MDNVEVVREFLRAQNLEQIGRVDDAIVLYEAALEAGFDSIGPYDRLIALYGERSQHREVVRVAQAALDNVHTHADKRSWYELMRDEAAKAADRVPPRRSTRSRVSLREQLIDRIERSGPMPFAAYMSLALYDPKHGYYATGETRTGWRGHFLTSPELDPAYGALWAAGFEEIWVASGRGDEFHVVEIGPAEGGFAAAVLGSVAGDFADRLRYHLVERVPAVAERQRARLAHHGRVEWHSSIVDLPRLGAGCIFANEVLDNLPVHLVRQDADGLKELCVEVTDGELNLTARPPSNPELQNFLQRVGVELAEGNVYEIGLAAESLVARAAQVIDVGALIFVDYGDEASELAHRPTGSMLCYSESGVDADPLERPGEKDITVHANWTAIEAALSGAGLGSFGPRSQREVLISLGARTLDAQLKEAHSVALGDRKGAEAVALLSRRQALGALLDPGGLGGLQVLAGASSGIGLPFA